MRLSEEDLATLTEALDKTPYRSLRLEADGLNLHLTRASTGWTSEMLVPADKAISGQNETVGGDVNEPAIRAPLVGVFYRAPKPGDPPFVEVGSIVNTNTVIGIIETMKLMNAIPAGISGRITEVVADDATFVDAGQVLMRIEQEPA